MGAHGLNWKIFVKSGFRFAIYDKNYTGKQNFRFLGRFWNLRFSTEPHPSYEFKAYEREILRTNSFFFSSKKILLPAVFADPIMQLKTLIVCCIFDFIRKYIN